MTYYGKDIDRLQCPTYLPGYVILMMSIVDPFEE